MITHGGDNNIIYLSLGFLCHRYTFTYNHPVWDMQGNFFAKKMRKIKTLMTQQPHRICNCHKIATSHSIWWKLPNVAFIGWVFTWRSDRSIKLWYRWMTLVIVLSLHYPTWTSNKHCDTINNQQRDKYIECQKKLITTHKYHSLKSCNASNNHYLTHIYTVS